MNKKTLALAVQAAIVGTLSFQAFAQETPVEVKATSSTATAQQGAENKGADEKIQVTGTRIKRDSFSMATPLISIGVEDIQSAGIGSLADILVDEIPALSASYSNTSSQSSVQNTGLSTVDLRHLGTDRTLTLIDGRRVVSNSYSGNYVSLSTIPNAMVDRVEVISGGASAIYGSDAIAGVVNIITQQSKQGLDLNVRGGETTNGGGREFTIDSGYGASIDNANGYLYMGVSWDREFGLMQNDRSRSAVQSRYRYDEDEMCNQNYTLSGWECMSDVTQEDWRYKSNDIPGGHFENDWYYNDDNELKEDFNLAANGFTTSAYDWLRVPNDRVSAAVKFDYDLPNDVRVYAQLQFSQTTSVHKKAPEGQDYNDTELYVDPITGEASEISAGTIKNNNYVNGAVDNSLGLNPYIPDEISAGAGSTVTWDRTFWEVGQQTSDNKRTTVRTWAGLQGNAFDGSWDWDISVGYGTFKQHQKRLNELNIINLGYGLDVEYAEDGVTVQCQDDEARANGCVPVNIFGIGSITEEAADYIRANPTLTTRNTQYNISGYMTGDLFAMPAGMMSAAVGFEYRKDKQDLDTDELFRNGGMTFNMVPTFSGSIDVKEVFAEVYVPLLTSLSAEASVRVADYSHVGMTTSYRVGLMWEPIEGLGIRSNFAHALRAPSITETWSPPRGDYDSVSDVCDGTTATSTGTTDNNCRLDPAIAAVIALSGVFESNGSSTYSPNAGNADLKEESADTFTLGMTWAPTFVKNLQFAIDYYDIDVDDAIASTDNSTILRECYNSELGYSDSNPFCQLISRDAEGDISQILQVEENQNNETARGYDIAMSYEHGLSTYGKLKFRADMTHMIERSKTSQGTDGLITTEYVGELSSGVFANEASTSVTWYTGDWRVQWRTKFKSSAVDDHTRVADWELVRDANLAAIAAGEGVADWETPAYLYYGSYITHDISVNYDLDLKQIEDMDIYAGIRNLFDNQGPFVANSGTGDLGLVADGIGNYLSEYGRGTGRFAYVGVKMSF